MIDANDAIRTPVDQRTPAHWKLIEDKIEAQRDEDRKIFDEMWRLEDIEIGTAVLVLEES